MKKESGNERNAGRSVAAWQKTELIREQGFAAFCALLVWINLS